MSLRSGVPRGGEQAQPGRAGQSTMTHQPTRKRRIGNMGSAGNTNSKMGFNI